MSSSQTPRLDGDQRKDTSRDQHELLRYVRHFLSETVREVDAAIDQMEVQTARHSAVAGKIGEAEQTPAVLQQRALARVLTVEALLRKGLGFEEDVPRASTHNGNARTTLAPPPENPHVGNI